jgi:maltooligosyltrehalose trehalohydrolase
MRIGANYLGKGQCEFLVWAPLRKRVSVRILSGPERLLTMERNEKGYWAAAAEDLSPETLYVYRIGDGLERPDPASHSQPAGVHGPSQIVDHRAFPWEDSKWKGLPLKDFIIYELHVGTFTPPGTFDAVIDRLDYLRELGITALEIMPVAQFPGMRNWGYDGVFPFAPQNSYGGPVGLKKLVNACHLRGLAVILDVVYNHLGPEGNYLHDFGPYFTNRYRTPWGAAVNFDGAYSDEVRRFLVLNALYWVTEFHFDSLRIDAVHGIYDFGARHFLQELAEVVHRNGEAMGRNVNVIAESDLNDVRVINPPEVGGHGLDAQWNEDFHHALHTLLTGERTGYYEDFGELSHLEKAVSEGFVYTGQYSSYRKRRHGNSSKDRPAQQFVGFSQNHDQVGNRAAGDRLSQNQPPEKLRLAAGAVLLSPHIPLLFMGEEYAETSPFHYFVSHGDKALIESVRKGRQEEFSAFGWAGPLPDPQEESTFSHSKLHVELHSEGGHKKMFEFYKELILLRRRTPSLADPIKENTEVKSVGDNVLFVRRWVKESETFCLYNFSEVLQKVHIPVRTGPWEVVMDSSSVRWGGENPEPYGLMIGALGEEAAVDLSPWSFVFCKRVCEDT